MLLVALPVQGKDSHAAKAIRGLAGRNLSVTKPSGRASSALGTHAAFARLLEVAAVGIVSPITARACLCLVHYWHPESLVPLVLVNDCKQRLVFQIALKILVDQEIVAIPELLREASSVWSNQ